MEPQGGGDTYDTDSGNRRMVPNVRIEVGSSPLGKKIKDEVLPPEESRAGNTKSRAGMGIKGQLERRQSQSL